MDNCINELENYLSRAEQLNNYADYLLAESKKAESAGEYEKCRLCNKQWSITKQAVCFLNNQIDRHIMYRLPPMGV